MDQNEFFTDWQLPCPASPEPSVKAANGAEGGLPTGCLPKQGAVQAAGAVTGKAGDPDEHQFVTDWQLPPSVSSQAQPLVADRAPEQAPAEPPVRLAHKVPPHKNGPDTVWQSLPEDCPEFRL